MDARILVGGPRTDGWIARLAGSAQYEWLPSNLHAKTFVVDGLWSSVGSMNIDNRSLALNEMGARPRRPRPVNGPEAGHGEDEGRSALKYERP